MNAAARKPSRPYPERLRKRRTDRKKVSNKPSAFALRFDTFEQYDHIKNAVASLDPKPSLNVFILEAATERARLLGYPPPV